MLMIADSGCLWVQKEMILEEIPDSISSSELMVEQITHTVCS